jgi:hypothetical protein
MPFERLFELKEKTHITGTVRGRLRRRVVRWLEVYRQHSHPRRHAIPQQALRRIQQAVRIA